jgi:hypothetical protein
MSEEKLGGFKKMNNEELEGCCGFSADEMLGSMRGCPCASMMKGSRKALFGFFLGGSLLFLIVVGGWILGVTAFLRTL